MPPSEQEQQLERPQRPGSKRPAIATIALVLGISALICFTIGLTFSVLSVFGLLPIIWSNYLSIAFNTFAAIFTVLTGLLSISPRFLRWASSLASAEAGPSPSFLEPSYSNISSLPPPTDPKTILQREEAVKQIYETLIQPEITAMVLTGIAGIGKSTLAALVYCYVENRRHQRWRSFPRGRGPFAGETLWLKVDPSMKMIDIAGTLYKHLGKPMPANFDTLPPEGQALALTGLMKTTKKPRLIILDQFDTLFDIHTGDALVHHPGIGEWLDALNSQRSKCKILFTSCSWLRGAMVYPRTHMQEYHVRGVSVLEGRELLRKHGLECTETELGSVIELCDGHMRALTELINLLQTYQLSLTTFLKSDSYFQPWSRNIAFHLLRNLYARQLELEHELLSAFAIYPIPVPLEAAEAVLESKPAKAQILKALDVLLTQHLLSPWGEGDYQLHPIVAHYIKRDLEESDEQSNYRPLRETHIKAAEYCLQQVMQTRPPQGKRRNIRDVRFLVEAIRQHCQSEQWQKAYELMSSENIAADLKSRGENTILLDLYQLLLPLDRWHPQDAQEADIYSKLGEILTEMISIDSSHADKALQYFKRSLTLYNQMEDYKGKCSILRDIGKLYLKQNQYETALAFFMDVEKLLKETQSSGGEEVAVCKEELRRQVGEEQYDTLLREIEPQAEQIIKQILS